MTLCRKSESFELLHPLRSLWNTVGQNSSANTESLQKATRTTVYILKNVIKIMSLQWLPQHWNNSTVLFYHASFNLENLLLDGWTIRAASQEVHPIRITWLQLSGGPVHSPAGFLFIHVRETQVYWLTTSYVLGLEFGASQIVKSAAVFITNQLWLTVCIYCNFQLSPAQHFLSQLNLRPPSICWGTEATVAVLYVGYFLSCAGHMYIPKGVLTLDCP